MLTQRQIKILIIDDDEDDYFIISDYLNEIDAHQPFSARVFLYPRSIRVFFSSIFALS